MIVSLVAFPALLGFWLFVGWRVRVEKGRVLAPSPWLLRLRRAFEEMMIALALALDPILRAAAAAMVEWGRQQAELQRILEAGAADVAETIEEAWPCS